MGSSLGKQKQYSSTSSVSELQQKILYYLFFSQDHNIESWDFSDVLKACQKFGFTSLEHFLGDIPPHVLKNHDIHEVEVVGTNNKGSFVGVGSRFVVRNDLGIKGQCTDIKIRISNQKECVTFIEMRLDQPRNGRVVPSLEMIYPMDDLLLEKHYLQELIRAKMNEGKAEAPKLSASSSLTRSKKTKQQLPTESVTIVKKGNEPSTSSPTPSKKKKRANSQKELHQIDSIPNINNAKTNYPQNDISIPDSEQNITPPKLYSVVVSQSVQENGFTKSKKTKSQTQPSLIAKTPPPSQKLSLTGKRRGIHGASNSCYMDSLLFSLFYNTSTFNGVFLQGKDKDSEDAIELRKILTESVVIPLNRDLYCSPSSLRGLRSFLSKFDDRFQGAMMDIEELVYQMLEEVLDEPHFLQYNNDTKDYIHQILTEGEEDDHDKESENTNNQIKVTDLQSCLENSFKLWGELKLLQCPNPAFLIQFPRSDGDLIQYDGILPNSTLNLGSLYANEEKACTKCQNGIGEWECGICKNPDSSTITEFVSYCSNCVNIHQLQLLPLRCGHSIANLHSKSILQLQSIICINSAHYTAIVKSFDGNNGKPTPQWLHFDSMAGTYPEVIPLNDFETELSQTETSIKNGTYANNNSSSPLDKWVNKAMRDCHICIYLPTPWHQPT